MQVCKQNKITRQTLTVSHTFDVILLTIYRVITCGVNIILYGPNNVQWEL